MLARVKSLTLLGLTAEEVIIEADTHRNLPSFTIVGLGDRSVTESRERVRSAMKHSGFAFPRGKVVVNLAPAHIKKHGPRFDLPIALGILQATDQIPFPNMFEESIFVGELAFTGELRSIPGILPTSSAAAQMGYKKIYVPYGNAPEAALIRDIEVFGCETLKDIFDHLIGQKKLLPQAPTKVPTFCEAVDEASDMKMIQGQEHAKRALEIAAAGAHNILMSGPPGSGKTMLARSFATLLPPLTVDEALEITKIHSIAGLTGNDQVLATQRPFRSVHHTASSVAIVGGGSPPKPGEISLAHRGVLFLDELPEFQSSSLEVLRQPLENASVTIARASGTCTFPAQMSLIAAMNPCPCGFVNDPVKPCLCTPYQIDRYKNRLSGPLLDRMDMHIEVPRIDFEKLTSLEEGENSATIRARVKQARARQAKRFKTVGITTNAEMNTPLVKRFCPLDEKSNQLLKTAMSQMNLSGRAFYRIVKLSRTIADLEGEKNILFDHVAEAIRYRG